MHVRQRWKIMMNIYAAKVAHLSFRPVTQHVSSGSYIAKDG